MRVAIIAVLLLAGCGGQNNAICEKPTLTVKSVGGCIHHTAYQFAHAAGTNTELAKAVTKHCDKQILESAELAAVTFELSADAMDKIYTTSRANAEEDALRRIIQAKAGNCDAPNEGL